MKEKYIYINNRKTKYTVTTKGDVYSLDYGRHGVKKKLKPCKNQDTGYMYVNIYYKKKLYRKSIHRLVAEAFIPIPEKYVMNGLTKDDLEVNHKNGDKTKNNMRNLEWVTGKDNTEHAISHGLRKVHYGEHATDAKITEYTARKICQMLESNTVGVREISTQLQISPSIVSNIKHKKAWLAVSKEYNIDNHDIKSPPICNKKSKPVKITEGDVINICELLQNTMLSVKEISDTTNINTYKINSILYGTAWTQISKNYDFSKRRRR